MPAAAAVSAAAVPAASAASAAAVSAAAAADAPAGATPGGGGSRLSRAEHPDAFFEKQPTSRRDLPDPAPLVVNLARCMVEILAGAREIEQLARWVTDDVYRHLMKRVVLAARARNAHGEAPSRPAFSVGSVRVTEPKDGVVEAVVVIHGRARSRAVAVRLEGLDRRWRATAVHVL
ncbi:hypothetical protein GCM10025780_36620 [Frondihabitans cladoniiphilus]|uniref:3-hydroxyacyl-CoA dehydrogenase n=1 Tax=Frondihabitans cladoniiphilus TaxID=715785 RepID=A0ABP8WF13_9MICO